MTDLGQEGGVYPYRFDMYHGGYLSVYGRTTQRLLAPFTNGLINALADTFPGSNIDRHEYLSSFFFALEARLGAKLDLGDPVTALDVLPWLVIREAEWRLWDNLFLGLYRNNLEEAAP